MKKLLVALDGSPRERAVLDTATTIAQSTGASLVLVKVVGIPNVVPEEAFAMKPTEVEALLERRAQTHLEKLFQEIPFEHRGKVLVVTGTPWDGICRAAHEENVELIVIGSHGYGGIDRLLGTTASKVVNHADRSVLVVRERSAVHGELAK